MKLISSKPDSKNKTYSPLDQNRSAKPINKTPDKPKGESNEKYTQWLRHQLSISIVGNSTIRSINPSLMKKKLKQDISVENFLSVCLDDIEHYIKPA